MTARKKSKRSKSNKKSKKQKPRSKPKNFENDLEKQLKFYHDETLKFLNDKKTLKVDHSNMTLSGNITKKELEKMPWMFNINPIWTIPEPYTFQISFKKENNIVKKYLVVKNGDAKLINQTLNH